MEFDCKSQTVTQTSMFPMFPLFLTWNTDHEKLATQTLSESQLLINNAELCCKIFSFLDVKTLLNCDLTCKSWNEISNNPASCEYLDFKTCTNTNAPHFISYNNMKRFENVQTIQIGTYVINSVDLNQLSQLSDIFEQLKSFKKIKNIKLEDGIGCSDECKINDMNQTQSYVIYKKIYDSIYNCVLNNSFNLTELEMSSF